jgi:membrane-bound ClpP family serine protease
MTIGAALLVIVVGVLIAVLASPTIGWIVAAIGVVGLIVALLTSGRNRARL